MSHQAFIQQTFAEQGSSEDEDGLLFEEVGDSTPSHNSVEALFSDNTSQTARTTPDPVYDPASRSLHDRTYRKTVHQAHTLSLFGSVRHRNALANDQLLQARLLSCTPMELQDGFVIPQKQGLQARVDAFDKALRDLLVWWHSSFEIDSQLQGMTLQPLEAVWQVLEQRGEPSTDALYEQLCNEGLLGKAEGGGSKKGKEKAVTHEVIRDAKSLSKRALSMCGSTDMSVLLFVALCRALRLQTRLVASLQPLSPSPAAEKPKPEVKVEKPRKRKASATSQTGGRKKQKVLSAKMGDDELVPMDIDVKPSVVEKVKPAHAGSIEEPINLDSDLEADQGAPSVKTCTKRPKAEPPVFWVEIYSRDLGRWISVDVVRKRLHSEKIMTPSLTNKENVMSYVVAVEQDGHSRDVTLRYADDWYARGWKERAPDARTSSGWWARAVLATSRRYQVNRDRAEEAALRKRDEQQLAIFPSIVGDFKDHPRYVLERFLRRDEACYPRSPVGLLWNKSEYVFLRSSVVRLRSVLGWQRAGRYVHECDLDRAIKTHFPRGGRGGEEALYAEAQTALILNEPVGPNGEIETDADGFVRVLQPHMMPPGAAHLNFKGAAELARKHDRPFAKAATSLTLRKGVVAPVPNGIVVSLENAAFLQKVNDKAVANSQARALEKQMLERWTLLLRKLAIQQRLLQSTDDEMTIKADDIDEFTM